MASASKAFLSANSSSFFIFFMCFSMHACISSNARDIRVTNNAGSLKGCEAKMMKMHSFDQQGASTFVGQHEHGSPCKMIVRVEFEFDALFGSEAKEEEHATTKSGRKVVESSSRMNFIEATEAEVSGGSENNINSYKDIIDMDYHLPHRKSPIHNK